MMTYKKVENAKIKVKIRRFIKYDHWLYWFDINGDILFPSVSKDKTGLYMWYNNHFSPTLPLKEFKVWLLEHLYLATYPDGSQGYCIRDNENE